MNYCFKCGRYGLEYDAQRDAEICLWKDCRNVVTKENEKEQFKKVKHRWVREYTMSPDS